MIIQWLYGSGFELTNLGDVVTWLFASGFDIALFVFFLNHLFDVILGGRGGHFR